MSTFQNIVKCIQNIKIWMQNLVDNYITLFSFMSNIVGNGGSNGWGSGRLCF